MYIRGLCPVSRYYTWNEGCFKSCARPESRRALTLGDQEMDLSPTSPVCSSRTTGSPQRLRHSHCKTKSDPDPFTPGRPEFAGLGSRPCDPASFPAAAGNRDACLHLRPAPRAGCRPHLGDRQCHPQADAGRPAAGAGRLLLLLGHSTIVVLLSVAIALTAAASRRISRICSTSAD